MATILYLHAHPDDECMLTSGSMAKAKKNGDRVIMVTCTNGEEGEYPEGFVSSKEELAQVRRREVAESAEIIGVDRLVLLGYHDSGMAGTEANSNPIAFCNIDLEEAARRVSDIIAEEGVDVIVGYDSNGGYGHPDHIMVHKVALRASQISEIPFYQATMNRDYLEAMMKMAAEAGDFDSISEDERPSGEFGTPEAELDTFIDVSDFVDIKKRSLQVHKSQQLGVGFVFNLTDDQIRMAFGTEWMISPHFGDGNRRSWMVDNPVAS
ncbi:MAG: PIG-L family deacetylase [Actinomycetota bacterium]|nr:PIG-L family deacetylase [Actinomycetota bacterium]